MRSRLAVLVTVVVAAAALAFTVSRIIGPGSSAGIPLPTQQASYLGVNEKGPPDT